MKLNLTIVLLFVLNYVYSKDLKNEIHRSNFQYIQKNVIDFSKINVKYLFEYHPDPSFYKKKIKAQTFLQIGEYCRCFKDYNYFLFDSLNDVAASSKNMNKLKMTTALMNLAKRMKFNNTIISGYVKNKILFQRSVVLNEIYQYEDSIPSLQWQLLEKDTVILDHPCHLASCEYRGRTYRAWYADDVDLPYGPYVFEGLPGLIFQIEDVQKHYCFKLNGINHISHKQPIYFNTSDKVVPTTRERVRKIYKQYCEHPLHSIVQSNPAIKIPQSALMNEKSKPYNPIELK